MNYKEMVQKLSVEYAAGEIFTKMQAASDKILIKLAEFLLNFNDSLRTRAISILNKSDYHTILSFSSFLRDFEKSAFSDTRNVPYFNELLNVIAVFMGLDELAHCKLDDINGLKSIIYFLDDLFAFVRVTDFNVDAKLQPNVKVVEFLFTKYQDKIDELFQLIEPIIQEHSYLIFWLNEGLLPKKVRGIRAVGLEILRRNSKINTLGKNSVFTYNLIKNIYTCFSASHIDFEANIYDEQGLKAVLDLIKYDSGASENINSEIEKGNEQLVLNYCKFLRTNGILNDDPKFLHYAFRYWPDIRELICDIFKSEPNLSEEEIKSLRSIILNGNRFSIKTYNELRNYKDYINTKLNSIFASGNLNLIKDFLAAMFGYSTSSSILKQFTEFKGFKGLKKHFTDFRFDNYTNLSYALSQVKSKIPQDEYERLKYTPEEMALISFMKQIIEAPDIETLKSICTPNRIGDFANTTRSIIFKIRTLYTYQFNSQFTDIETLKQNVLASGEKGKISIKKARIKNYKGENEEVEYTIISLDKEKFNFAAHTINSYSVALDSYSSALLSDPSLWTRLEGSSILCGSTVSDKGLHIIPPTMFGSVTFLFNNLGSLLYMYGGKDKDANSDNGINRFEPISFYNCMMDLDALNQMSSLHIGHNEITMEREGLMPKAILCIKSEPSEEEIRAAAYFHISIIRINVKRYEEINRNNYIEAKRRFAINPTILDIENILLGGINDNTPQTDIDFCYNSIMNSYEQGNLEVKDAISLLRVLFVTVSRIYSQEQFGWEYMQKIHNTIEITKRENNITDSPKSPFGMNGAKIA